MNPDEARETLAQVADRREQTLSAGAAAWSGKALWSLCSSTLALGVLTDADLTWLWAVLMVFGVGVAWRSGVRLRPTESSRRWNWALAGSFVVAFAAYVLFQFPARALDFPFPNTVGAVGACLVIVTLGRAVQARWAASLRA